MEVFCKYCKTLLEESHIRRGFCDDCYEEILESPNRLKKEIIDKIETPFFVIDKESTRFVTANDKFLSFINKSVNEIAKQLGGEVIGCIHSDKPGGCGGTHFCKDCPIRNFVQHTIEKNEKMRN